MSLWMDMASGHLSLLFVSVLILIFVIVPAAIFSFKIRSKSTRKLSFEKEEQIRIENDEEKI